MRAYFYSHLVKWEDLLEKMDQLELREEHKYHLTSLLDGILHQLILEMLLSKLSIQDKQALVYLLEHDQKKEEIMFFLNGKIDMVEEEIVLVVENFKKETLADIKEVLNNG